MKAESSEARREQAKNLRYKRPALALMGWDTITAELDILRGENAAVLQVIKEIEKIYDRQAENQKWQDDPEFERLLRLLPERMWIE